MEVFRIAKCAYIRDLSGWGAANYPGRWNSRGVYMLYTAASPSLALLESIVHISDIPRDDFCMITLFVPDESITGIGAAELPESWYRNPPPEKLKKTGDSFIKQNKFLALRIPSAVMPEDFNILLNPQHPDFGKVKITGSRSITFDERLIKK